MSIKPETHSHAHPAADALVSPAVEKSVAEQLSALQKTMDTLGNRVEHIQKEVAPQSIPRTQPRTPKEIQDARWATAGVGALFVGKIATIPGGIVGLYTAAKEHLPEGQKGAWNMLKALFNQKSGNSVLGDTTKWTAITFTIGAAVGGVLGYIRGHRLEYPKMLWKEPIQSTKVLLGLSEGYKEPEPHAMELAAQHEKAAAAAHDADKASPHSQWQNREDTRRNEASQASSADLAR